MSETFVAKAGSWVMGMNIDTWTVSGGGNLGLVSRPCTSREEAEDWALKLLAAGLGPVKINGVVFEPAPAGEDEAAGEVARPRPGRKP